MGKMGGEETKMEKSDYEHYEQDTFDKIFFMFNFMFNICWIVVDLYEFLSS